MSMYGGKITQESPQPNNITSDPYKGDNHRSGQQGSYSTASPGVIQITHDSFQPDSNGQNQGLSPSEHPQILIKRSNQQQHLNNNNNNTSNNNNNIVTWRKADVSDKNHNSCTITAVVGGQQHIVTNTGGQRQLFYSNTNPSDSPKDKTVVNGKRLPGNEDCVSSPQNDKHSNKRMNSNGFGRVRMTGSSTTTNENLSWLADVAASQSSQSQSQPSEALLSSRTETQDSQGHSPLLSSGLSQGTIFRPSVTMAEGGQRLMAGSQYIGGNPSVGAYSPLYSVHGQPQHVSNLPQQYSAIYQYPTYSHPGTTLMSTGHYPHVESYSAVLASMGSHVQHGNHSSQTSQLTRAPFMSGTPMSQYAPIGPHRSLSSASSPGPHHPSGSFSLPAAGDSIMHDARSPKVEVRDIDRGHRSASSSNLREERIPSYVGGSSLGKSPSSSTDKDLFYKVPSGKEGSLKHRILTRPLDAPGDCGSADDTYKYSSSLSRHDEPSAKRTRLMTAASGSSHTAEEGYMPSAGPGPPQDNLRELSELQGLPPPHLHYPAHFMKGSVIQLANNKLKRVEDLETSDFVHSAEISSDLKIDSSTVIRIDEHLNRGTAILGFSVGEHKVKVTVEATLEHPFFVFGQGWSSCCPERTSQRYGLDCHKLTINDVCISLTHKDATIKAAEISQQQARSSTPTTSRQGIGHDFPYTEGQRPTDGSSVTNQSRVTEGNVEVYPRRPPYTSSENIDYNPNKRKDGHGMDRKQ